MTELKIFQKQNLDPSRKLNEASNIAQKLLEALNETSTLSLLLEANKPKASSSLIQNCFLPVTNVDAAFVFGY